MKSSIASRVRTGCPSKTGRPVGFTRCLMIFIKYHETVDTLSDRYFSYTVIENNSSEYINVVRTSR